MRGLVLGLLLCALSAAAPAGETVALALVARDGRSVSLEVEVARTPAERRQGLMGRQSLAAGHGMLFDFERDDSLVMWMKDTFIPLDMVFVAASGEVVDVIANTTPLSETFLPARHPARYVIELNAGEATALGLAPGARLRLPLKAPTALP